MRHRRNGMASPLRRVLLDDHRRLDALLQSAIADPLKVEQPVYDQSRAGLAEAYRDGGKDLYLALMTSAPQPLKNQVG